MADTEGRRLSDLRVIDLRTELEKRGLDKSGVKVVLLDRLERALQDEGKDSKSFCFDPLPAEKPTQQRTPVKRTSRSGSTAEQDQDEDVNVDEMVVKDEIVDEELDGDRTATTDTSKDESNKIKEEEVVVAKKREAPSASSDEAPAVKKVCKEESPNQPVANKRKSDINGMDTEDSINLDIGEDELLNEEGEGRSKATKDGSSSGGGEGERDQEQAEGGQQEEGPTPTATDQPQGEAQSAQDTTVPDHDNSANVKNTSGVTDADKGTDDKEWKKSSSSATSRNLWVSGLSGTTRAKDLKQLCSRHGKVVGAKVVTNARTPGSRCYGYVTMVSAQDADSCIKHLHRTELHGRMISVEKAKSELGAGAGGWGGSNGNWGSSRSRSNRDVHDRNKDGEDKKDKEKNSGKEGDAKDGEGQEKGDEKSGEGGERRDHSKSKGTDDGRKRIRDRLGRRSGPDKSPRRGPQSRDVLSFSKIRKEREAQRERERIRRARSEERRRRLAEQALREQERRHRMEKQRLALEREKLRIERERIEREKNELHRIERERQKLEREKLEFERLELKRAQMKLEEERRAKQRGYPYSSGNSPPWPKGGYEGHGGPKGRGFGGAGGGAPPPPPPHFGPDPTASAVPPPPTDKRQDRDRERRPDYPRHPTSGNNSNAMKYTSNGSSYDSRQPLPPGTRPRDQRYESGVERSGSGSGRYGGGGGESGRRSPKATHGRYPDTVPTKGDHKLLARDHRYTEPSAPNSKGEYERAGNNWHSSSGGSASKGGFPSAPPSWSKPGESWSGGGVSGTERYTSGSGGGGGGGYGGGESSGRYTMHQPAPPGSQPPSFAETRYASQRDYRGKY